LEAPNFIAPHREAKSEKRLPPRHQHLNAIGKQSGNTLRLDLKEFRRHITSDPARLGVCTSFAVFKRNNHATWASSRIRRDGEQNPWSSFRSGLSARDQES
jgi:hypothetical protein